MVIYETFRQVINEDEKMNGSYEIDGLRKAPVDKLIVHHSAGATFRNKPVTEVIDFISEMHKERFYRGGVIPSRHTDRYRKQSVFCAYHFLMWPNRIFQDAGDIVRQGWSVTPTMWGVLENVAGGTTSYEVNATAIQLCVMGDYTRKVPENDFFNVFTKFFKSFFQYVKDVHGDNGKLKGHRDYDPKPCPGMIYDMFPDMLMAMK